MGEMADLCYEEGLEQAYKDHGVDGYDVYEYSSPVSQEPSSSIGIDTCLHGYIKSYCVMENCSHNKFK